jgi:hypothetical protein
MMVKEEISIMNKDNQTIIKVQNKIFFFFLSFVSNNKYIFFK